MAKKKVSRREVMERARRDFEARDKGLAEPQPGFEVVGGFNERALNDLDDEAFEGIAREKGWLAPGEALEPSTGD